MATEANVPDSLDALRADDELLNALVRGELPDPTPLTGLLAAFRKDCVRQDETS